MTDLYKVGADYREAITHGYFEIAHFECDQEDSFDDIETLQRQLVKQQASLRTATSRVLKVRAELAAADVDVFRATVEQERENGELVVLKARLIGMRGAADELHYADTTSIIQELINTKTRLAEATEQRDQKCLDKKRIEGRLAKVKYDLAMILAVICLHTSAAIRLRVA
tara:strand:- start:97 stop:606 length:510 start_codon:yes stop_codon:yes gene_type:complete